MGYSTTWYHLDKNDVVLSAHKQMACFSSIINSHNFEKECKYLLYDFSNMQVTQEEARKYFLFLKSIPEFKELMPKSCTKMATEMKYKVDLHKYNGTKIFTMLTLIRAVVEDPKIVKEVISFSRKFKYSISNFSILKMCGSVHQLNYNHWITYRVDKRNINKMFGTTLYWNEQEPCINTGLGRNIHTTFNHDGDIYITKYPVKLSDIKRIKDEKNKPAIKKEHKQRYDTSYLQLGF